MSRTLKRIGTGLLVAVLAGTLPGTERGRPVQSAAPSLTVQVPQVVQTAIQEAGQRGEAMVDMDMIVRTPEDFDRLKRAVTAAGGEVLLQERTYARVKLPLAAAEELPRTLPVVAVGVNERLAPEASYSIMNKAVQPADAAGLAESNLKPIGTDDFRQAHGVTGKGLRVAVIDSGIDPGHAGFRQTVTGEPKLVDWKDFTGEGLVKTPHAVAWQESGSYTAPDSRTYRLPSGKKAPRSGTARFGFWDELGIVGVINRDLNQNGSQVDKLGVLVVDAAQAGVYDTVYVDANNNRDFSDEEPLHVFRTDSQSVTALGDYREGRMAARRLNVVAADIHPGGSHVYFGFDGMGHGTQVAGVLAGNDPGGLIGVAPGAQLMALKAVSSDGQGEWFAIRQAVQYAADNKANIINISLAGLANGVYTDKTAPEFLNRVARQYGILIVLAAGNNGPGLSSGATVGNPSEVLAVGGYMSPAMWLRDFGLVVPSEGVYFMSAMGPRADGSYLPNLIAPWGSPTTSPAWLHETGYVSAGGTSIAAPHAAGTAALLMEAGRAAGIHSDWLSVKRAMELGARRILDLASFEQGHGVVWPEGAFEYLKNVNALPAISAKNQEGHSGLLARSYRPGTAEFSLTNLDAGTTPVTVFSSESWVKTPLQTLTLPQNVARQLPLQLTPPTEPGVHTAFLSLTQQNRVGPNVQIPITYVRPIELATRPNSKYTTSDRLEVGRFRRYYLEVVPGALNLDVSVRVLPGIQNTAQGSVKVHVFRPDGQSVYQSPDIGANGQGLSTLFQTENPVPGVWEVVVTGLPDRAGNHLNAGYALEATSRPGPLGRPALQLSQQPGTTVTHRVTISNPFPAFTGSVSAVGVVKSDPSLPWRVVSHKGTIVEDFTLTEFASRLRVEIDNPVIASGSPQVDLSLYFERSAPETPRGIVTLKQSITKGSNRESIEMVNLPPGRYLVSVIANVNLPSLQYQYRRLTAIEGFNVTVDDSPRRHAARDTWSVGVTVQAPGAPGRYSGYLLLRDTENDTTLAWIPFEVAVGQPALSVEPLAAQLAPGRPSTVFLEVRDVRTGELVDTLLSVNGQRFVTRSGRVSVPVNPSGQSQILRVQADVPGYHFLNKEISVPVTNSLVPHPVGTTPVQENSAWRRKVMSQSP